MKEIDAGQTTIWGAGDYTGVNAPMQRVTVQRANLVRFAYELADRNPEWNHSGKYRTILFGQPSDPIELPNVKSVAWERDITADVATCTITLYNTKALPIGTVPDNDDELDQPGFYSPGRGESTDLTARWGHTTNAPWTNLLVPDRLVRTYEGYGFDPDVPPSSDAAMSPSGCWLIDKVGLTNDGLIVLQCRDVGRLLLDHIMHPPVIPVGVYPLWWETYGTRAQYVYERGIVVDAYRRPSYDTDSNHVYVGAGVTDNGVPIVSGGGSVQGHSGADSVDNNNEETYWLSTGFRKSGAASFPWIQGRHNGVNVESVKISVKGGPYKMYVSLADADGWLGNNKIPYQPGAPDDTVDIGADIQFVASFLVNADSNKDYVLPRQYENIDKVRLTFTGLWNSGIGENWPYRVAVKDFESAGSVTSVDGPVNVGIGRYSDYTDIIKWLVCWGGFYWPGGSDDYILETDGNKITYAFTNNDNTLAHGRAWGDFENTGTGGKTKLTADIFDKRPLMDGIGYIREIIGFNFFIDEEGGVVWRSPNVWEIGSYISSVGSESLSTRTTDVIEVDENSHIMEIAVNLSSENQRERVFVANSNGKFGAAAYGFNPNPAVFRRVAGWTDQGFRDEDECQVMADLITVRQMFEYRTLQVTIPGHPAIQIDDQVRLIERVTAEHYLHYVRGISSEFNMEDRRWTYTLNTHWLGESPFDRWAFDPNKLAATTKLYLQAIGKL